MLMLALPHIVGNFPLKSIPYLKEDCPIVPGFVELESIQDVPVFVQLLLLPLLDNCVVCRTKQQNNVLVKGPMVRRFLSDSEKKVQVRRANVSYLG